MALSDEERRQQEVAAQIQLLLNANPALKATCADTWESGFLGATAAAEPAPAAAGRQRRGVAAGGKARPASAAAAVAASPAAGGAGGGPPRWRVVGGASAEGIVVRAGAGILSAKKDRRLSVGAIVQQAEIQGDRLNYQLLSGEGPATGWVSVRVKGTPLLELLPADGPPPDGDDGGDSDDEVLPVAPAPAPARAVARPAEAAARPTPSALPRTFAPRSGGGGGGGDDSVPDIDSLLASVDRDERRDEEAASRRQFFNMGSASHELELWSASRATGVAVGRGADFNFRSIRELGTEAAAALSAPAAAAPPPPAAAAAAAADGDDDDGGGGGRGTDLQRRLRGMARRR